MIKTTDELDAFIQDVIVRVWDIHEMEAYGGEPDFPIPSHKPESEIMLGQLTDLIEEAIGVTDDD